jgi:flagellin-like hook-associated protein FlgL
MNAAKTAEGALQTIHDILHRVRELSVAASNGTYQEEDRLHLEKEKLALLVEVDRITETTHYNGIKLLRHEDIREIRQVLAGYNYTEEINAPVALDTRGTTDPVLAFNPLSGEYYESVATPALPAGMTLTLTGSVNLNDATSLHGKSFEIGGHRYNFTLESPTLNFPSGSNITTITIPTSGAGTVKDFFDSLLTPVNRFGGNITEVQTSAPNRITFTGPLEDLGTAINGNATAAHGISASGVATGNNMPGIDPNITIGTHTIGSPGSPIGADGVLTVQLPMTGGTPDVLDINRLAGAAFTYMGKSLAFTVGGQPANLNGATQVPLTGTLTNVMVANRIQAALGALPAPQLNTSVTLDSNGELRITLLSAGTPTFTNGSFQAENLFTNTTPVNYSGGRNVGNQGTSINFSGINDVTQLLGKGFRVYDPTDPTPAPNQQFTNVMFVWNKPAGIPEYSMDSPDNGRNVVVELSRIAGPLGNINPSSLVSGIVSQLNPQLAPNTGLRAGTPGSHLFCFDMRPGNIPGANQHGRIENGVRTNFEYDYTRTERLEDLPAETFFEMPIYVSSFGPHNVFIRLPDLTMENLLLDRHTDFDLSTVEGANQWLDMADRSTEVVTNARTVLGADINRLEAVYNVLTNSEIETTSSESIIRDANIADDVMRFMKNQIISQAGDAVLAQASQMPRMFLHLLQ